MKTWVLNHKKISTLVVFILLSTWFFWFFIPKQSCLMHISSDSSYYIYDYDDAYFDTRNDALDYCMAQRWDF